MPALVQSLCLGGVSLYGKRYGLSCDEAVLKKTGYENKKAYADTLLYLSGEPEQMSCPIAFGEKSVKTGGSMGENQLTKAEIDNFKYGLPGDRKILNALTAAFFAGSGAVLVFLCYHFFCEARNGEKTNAEMIRSFIVPVFVFCVMAAIFLVCRTAINRRNNKIYQCLKNGEYTLVVSSISEINFRYQGSGKHKYRVDFYKCPEINGEITPISQRQFRRAKEGDKLKVVVVSKMHVIYGILE